MKKVIINAISQVIGTVAKPVQYILAVVMLLLTLEQCYSTYIQGQIDLERIKAEAMIKSCQSTLHTKELQNVQLRDVIASTNGYTLTTTRVPDLKG